MEILRRAAVAAERVIERRVLTARGLTYPQYLVMDVLHQEGGAESLGEVADMLGCSRGNVTGILDRLEKDRWIDRVRSTVDRRVVAAQLTPGRLSDWQAIKQEVTAAGLEIPPEVAAFLVKAISQLEREAS